jgi:hypothetical protein
VPVAKVPADWTAVECPSWVAPSALEAVRDAEFVE